jgi:hypothetical protein
LKAQLTANHVATFLRKVRRDASAFTNMILVLLPGAVCCSRCSAVAFCLATSSSMPRDARAAREVPRRGDFAFRASLCRLLRAGGCFASFLFSISLPFVPTVPSRFLRAQHPFQRHHHRKGRWVHRNERNCAPRHIPYHGQALGGSAITRGSKCSKISFQCRASPLQKPLNAPRSPVLGNDVR